MFHRSRDWFAVALLVIVTLCVTPVSTPAHAAATKTLTIKVSGLPAGAKEKLVVSGPGFKKTISITGNGKTKSVKLKIKAGSYVVRPADARKGSTRYYPNTYAKPTKVTSNRTIKVSFKKLVLTFTRVGKLKIGMTVAQAKKADPSFKTLQSYPGFCLQARTRDAMIFFPGPGTRLTDIHAKSYVATSKGIKKGSSYAAAKKAYRLTTSTVSTEDDSYSIYVPSGGGDSKPSLLLKFDPATAKQLGNHTADVSHSKVIAIKVGTHGWGGTCAG